MCCGKMVKFPNKRERTMLTTRNINVDLNKKGVKNAKKRKNEFQN